MAGLTTALQNLPLSFNGIPLSHKTPVVSLYFIHSTHVLFAIFFSMFALSAITDPKYLKPSTLLIRSTSKYNFHLLRQT